MMTGSSRLPGPSKVNLTSRSPTFSALMMCPQYARYIGLFFLKASKEKITSSAVTGLPSCQRASARSR